jgi:aryl-phospho-beta-D-glucosidase BglC (GH1 family)
MDMLRVEGVSIVDASGGEVRLRGACVGGWMNMENFINGYPGSESGMRAALREAIGEGKAEFFMERMADAMLGEADIRFMRDCGATVVRLPLNYRRFEDDARPFEYLDAGFARLDRALSWCERHGLYAILDLHSAQGWQNSDWHCDNESRHSLFWEHPHFQDRYIALWKELARRYAGRQVVAGYDIMNEPLCNAPRGRFTNIDKYPRNWPRINAVFRRAVEAIREVDADHIVFLEGDYFSNLFEGLEPPFAPNLAYSSHNYTASGFGPGAYPAKGKDGSTWDAEAQEKAFLACEGARFARDRGVPLWVGEFGSVYNGPKKEIGDRLRALDDQIAVFERHGAHWTTWTYKDVGVMGWVSLSPGSPYLRLVADELEAKRLLDADQWMGWLPDTPAKKSVRKLAVIVERTIGDERVESSANFSYLKQAALSSYVGGLMQPAYARLFVGRSEKELAELADSFAFGNCVVNQGLVEVVKRRIGAEERT